MACNLQFTDKGTHRLTGFCCGKILLACSGIIGVPSLLSFWYCAWGLLFDTLNDSAEGFYFDSLSCFCKQVNVLSYDDFTIPVILYIKTQCSFKWSMINSSTLTGISTSVNLCDPPLGSINKSLNMLYRSSTFNPINNGNRTEWSPIRSVIIRQWLTKSDDRIAGVWFVNHEYDYKQNWTTRSPVTN